MPTRMIGLGGALSWCLCTCGCTGVARVNLAQRTGGSAALVGQFQAYDGHTGRPISFAEITRRCRQADVVLFGERHADPVCNQLEAQLLHALASAGRPIALAMEFFETDTQADLDAYLAGRVEEAPFRERTRQGRAYVLSHRPLIELCRTARIPIVAANAPRRLVQAYRKSGLDYGTYRAGLDPQDQRWLPLRSEHLPGAYQERFAEIMRRHGPAAATTQPTTSPASQPASPPPARPAAAIASTQPASRPATQPAEAPPPPPASQPVTSRPAAERIARFYRSQLLWDDALADSLANFRQSFSPLRVMLIVGVFHVAHEGGTVAKFRARRPADRICTVVYRGTSDGRFAFDEQDRHAGDVIIYGILPPPKKEPPAGPPAQPTTTRPATTAPAPTSAPAGGMAALRLAMAPCVQRAGPSRR